MKRRQIISELWAQFPDAVVSWSTCSRCKTRLARGGRVCSACLTKELGELIGDLDDAIALVRALIEYKDLEKEILR